MALVSPGVQVSVTDQSNYAPSTNGSTAYVLLATAENKVAPGGTAYASGTLKENAGTVYNIASQRDLVNTFGNPIFNTSSTGSSINAGEQNEYGLLAAYSALGVSNNIYVQRADVDLAELTGTSIRPVNGPVDGTYWFDTADTNFGIFEWNASTQMFEQQTVFVDYDKQRVFTGDAADDDLGPDTSFGTIGSYVAVVTTGHNHIFCKRYDNTWQLVGNIGWEQGVPTVTGTVTSTDGVITASATISVNGQTIGLNIGDSLATVAGYINAASITGVSARVSSTTQLIITAIHTATSDGTHVDGKLNIVDHVGFALRDLGIKPGIYYGAALSVGPYYKVPHFETTDITLGQGRPTGSVWHKTSIIGNGYAPVVKQFNAPTNSWVPVELTVFTSNASTATHIFDPTGGGLNIPVGTMFADVQVELNLYPTVGSQFFYRKNAGPTVATATTPVVLNPSVNDQFDVYYSTGSGNFLSKRITVTTASPSGLVRAIVAADMPNVSAAITVSGAVTITHVTGGDIGVQDITGTPLANVGINATSTNTYLSATNDMSYLISNWAPLCSTGYYASPTAPVSQPVDNTNWYFNSPSRVDIMINTGSAWAGYRTVTADVRGYNLSNTNANGIIVRSSSPASQDNGNALVYGDLWLDTSDVENFPKINRWERVSGIDKWVAISNTDSVSQNGIIFADARWATSGNVDPALDDMPSMAELAVSSYVDLDAPDPTLHPRGMLLFNTRASGFNVKQFKSMYFTASAYPNQVIPAVESTWVSVVGYQPESIPNFGRKAQRGVVIAALTAAIDSSTSLREDATQFNLIACPGYPELMPYMATLNNDKGNTAFVIGDTPFRLPASETAIQNWASNAAGSNATGETALSVTDPYVGVYYPSGQTTDLSGNIIVVPPSHAVLKAILNSDNASYPWIAPAGTRRGIVDNISAIGYVDGASGAFISAGITQGLRDVMYANKINPLTNLPGAGLVIYGQKTLAGNPSSLDRINVARLVNYIRKQLNIVSRPFLFEPNDSITQKNVTAVVSGIMNDLVAKRGVADYLVVCDSSNNTPTRIDRNELWVDIAVQPTKDVEFIYIPIRLVAAGQLQSSNIAPATTVGTGA
jgi:hypothetical protein